MQPTPAFEPNPQIETMIAQLYRLTLAHASRMEMQFKDEWKQDLDLSSSAHLVRLARMFPNWVTTMTEISAEVLRNQGIQNWEEILKKSANAREYPTVTRFDLGNLLIKGDIQRRLELRGYPPDVCSDLLDGLFGRLDYISLPEDRVFQLAKLETALKKIEKPLAINLLNSIFELGEYLSDNRHPKAGPESTAEDIAFFRHSIGDSMMNPLCALSARMQTWSLILSTKHSLEFIDNSGEQVRIKADVDPLQLLEGAREWHKYLLAREKK